MFKVLVTLSWNCQYLHNFGQIAAIISKLNGNFPFLFSKNTLLNCIIKYVSRTNSVIASSKFCLNSMIYFLSHPMIKCATVYYFWKTGNYSINFRIISFRAFFNHYICSFLLLLVIIIFIHQYCFSLCYLSRCILPYPWWVTLHFYFVHNFNKISI